MKTKIVQVVGNGDPGGGTTAVLTLAVMLQAAGRAPVVVSQQGSYLLREAGRHGIAVRGLDFSSRAGAIACCAALVRILREEAPAVVHAHGNRAGLPVALAMHWLGRRGPRFVYTVHGFHFMSKKGLAFRLARLAEKYCIGKADWTNFVSQGDARIAQEQCLSAAAGRTRVIHNAVLARDFPALPAQRSTMDIAFIGRLTEQKNPLILLQIVTALARKVRVHVIGGGELDGELRRKADALGLERQFIFHGSCDRPSALRLASACSMLLLPSRWEGHPITVIEAMHMALPVVASDIPGTREIVDDGRTGYLVAADDVAGYARAIARLLDDAEHARQLGEAGRLVACERFSADRMLQANLDVYGLAEAGCAGVAATAA